MIDALDAQLAPLDRELRDYARRQPGCRALMRHYGIGPLTSVTILAELGDARRFSLLARGRPLRRPGHHRPPVRRPPRPRPPLPPRPAGAALGALRSRPMRPPARLTRPRLLPAGGRAARRQPRLPGRRAQAAQAQLPHAARTRRGGPAARMTTGLRAQPSLTPMHRGRLPACSCRHHRVDGLHRQSGRTASRNTPSTIMSPTRSHPGSRTEIRLGVRAHPTRTTNHAHAPPPPTGLTLRTSTDKEQQAVRPTPEARVWREAPDNREELTTPGVIEGCGEKPFITSGFSPTEPGSPGCAETVDYQRFLLKPRRGTSTLPPQCAVRRALRPAAS